jgi:hypothetical protein
MPGSRQLCRAWERGACFIRRRGVFRTRVRTASPERRFGESRSTSCRATTSRPTRGSIRGDGTILPGGAKLFLVEDVAYGTMLIPRAGCGELLRQIFNLRVESHDDLNDGLVYPLQGLVNQGLYLTEDPL